MTRATALIAFLALGFTAAPTAAQPAPDEDKSDKLDAKADKAMVDATIGSLARR